MNHPNIITLHEVGQTDGVDFLVTELVEGVTLRQSLKQGPLPLAEALNIVTQMAAALAAAHEAGIIHRDIKPENVMLRRDGLVKVLDFGLAKLSGHRLTAEASQAIESQTELGRVLGTVQYMSPEQALGEKIDHRSDIFSLGAVFYELIVGKPPFYASTPAATYDALLNKPYPPVKKIKPELPSELDTILNLMLKRDRAKRYQTTSDLLADLQQLQQRLSGASVSAKGRAAAPSWLWLQTAWKRWVMVVLGTLLLLIGGKLFWFGSGKHSALGFRRTDWQSQSPFFEQINLFSRSDDTYQPYRIPALAVTNAGTLIAAVDERKYGQPNTINLIMRRSTDLGCTWEPVRPLQALPGGAQAHESSLLVDRATGRIFCFYMCSNRSNGVDPSRLSNREYDPQTVRVHLIHSDDDGLTWNAAAPVDLTPHLKDPAWVSLYATSGHGIQTRGGRLIQPFGVVLRNSPAVAFVAYSDDHGATWKRGELTGNDIFDPKVMELNDGSLLLNARSTARARAIAVSGDGGRSFAPMTNDQALIEARCNADILRYASTLDGAPQNVILFSNPAHLLWRMRMTMRVSYDEGRSWPVASTRLNPI